MIGSKTFQMFVSWLKATIFVAFAIVAFAIAVPSHAAAQAQVGWTWQSCTDPTRDAHLTQQDAGGLVCRDKIDTLYSWGPFAKIDAMKQQQWTGRYNAKSPDGQKTFNKIFTTQSSYATFGYGNFAIRFRLKPNTKFRFFPVNGYNGCDQLTPAEVNDTVVVRYFDMGSTSVLDYILCGLGPVHSWSYGTPEHYQEMIRERKWIDSHLSNYGDYELYQKRDTGQDIFMPNGLDGHTFTEALWRKNLFRHQTVSPGQIYYNPSVPDKTRTAHFSTRWATYINPNAVNPNGPGPNATLTYRDFLNSKFRDNYGRTLWLNPNRQCSSKGITGVITYGNWEFTGTDDIIVRLSTGAVRYYKAQNASNICFTGEGSPGASCVGPMTRYN